MLADWYDSIGIACNCHTAFGEMCVVELGRNVRPLDPDLAHVLEHGSDLTEECEIYQGVFDESDADGDFDYPDWLTRNLPNWWRRADQPVDWHFMCMNQR